MLFISLSLSLLHEMKSNAYILCRHHFCIKIALKMLIIMVMIQKPRYLLLLVSLALSPTHISTLVCVTESFLPANWLSPCVGEQGHRWIHILPTLRSNRQERDSLLPQFINPRETGFYLQPSQEYLLTPVAKESVIEGVWGIMFSGKRNSHLYIQTLCHFAPLGGSLLLCICW